jgi:hypothetical protein
MRATDGSGELTLASYELFSDAEIEMLGRTAPERMLAGLSTRRYGVGLEPVGAPHRAGGHVHVALGTVVAVHRPGRDRAGRVARRELSCLDLWR